MTKHTTEDRRQAMEFANAVCALEGLHPSPEAQAMNEQIVRGEVSVGDAIAAAVESAKARAAAQRPAPPST